MNTKVAAAVAVLAGCGGLSSLVGALPAAAGSATISVSRTTGLLDGQLVLVSATGLSPQSPADVVQCSNAPGQPTIDVDGFAVGVSCTSPFGSSGYPFDNPNYLNVGNDGTISTAFIVHSGVIGPPNLGVDSSGHNAAADAASYPCPPTDAQRSAGASCVIAVGDYEGTSASVPISFASASVTTASISVAPAGGLSSHEQVTVSGSGFTPDSPWLVLECNLTPGEPTGQSSTPNLPVSCDEGTAVPQVNPGYSVGLGPGNGPSFPTSSVTSASGTMSTPLSIAEGNIGGSQQSAAYPCPPSPANLKAGGSCAVLVEDGAGQLASFTIGITGPIPVPTISLSASSGLVGGESIQVTGANFTTGQTVGVLECSSAPGQPTIPYAGVPVPVSCSNPVLTGASPTGDVSVSFPIIEGVTGPPTQGTDSTGGSAATDAAAYPCPPTAAQQASGVTCNITAGDLVGDVATVPITVSTGTFRLAAPVAGMAATPDGKGYWLVGGDGGVFTLGDAGFYGSKGGQTLNKAVVGMAPTPDGKGYWLVASDGGVFTFGDAGFYGSMGSHPINKPVVGIAATPDGKGYWLVASDGGVFTFGDAGFDGSMGSHPINKPVVGIAATPDGNGYWLAASDGGVFTFGDAGFDGSMGSHPINKPVVGIAGTPDGKGYWLAASDGGIFTFGDAVFSGSAAVFPFAKPFVGFAPTSDGFGYWLATSSGQVVNLGSAAPEGSLPNF